MVYKIIITINFFLNLISYAQEIKNPISDFSEIEVSTNINYPFYGEILEYEIYWGFINVGNAYIKIDKIVKIDEKNYAYHIISQAKSNSFIENFYPVKDINEALLDINVNKSYGYYKNISEGKYKRKEWVLYDYKDNTFRGERIKNKNTEIEKFSGLISPQTFDVLSALYLFRIYDLINKPLTILNVNTGKNWELNVKYHGKEKIETKNGKFKCFVLEPIVGKEGIFIPKEDKRLFVYISEKERLPVMLKAEVFIGSVTAKLVRIGREGKK